MNNKMINVRLTEQEARLLINTTQRSALFKGNTDELLNIISVLQKSLNPGRNRYYENRNN